MIDPDYVFPNNCVSSAALLGQQTTSDPTQGSLEDLEALGASLVNEFSVYPNPASDELIVNYTGGGYLEVFNAVGVVVKRIQLTEDSKQSIVDVRGLAPGIYYLSLRQLDGSAQTKKW